MGHRGGVAASNRCLAAGPVDATVARAGLRRATLAAPKILSSLFDLTQHQLTVTGRLCVVTMSATPDGRHVGIRFREMPDELLPPLQCLPMKNRQLLVSACWLSDQRPQGGHHARGGRPAVVDQRASMH